MSLRFVLFSLMLVLLVKQKTARPIRKLTFETTKEMVSFSLSTRKMHQKKFYDGIWKRKICSSFAFVEKFYDRLTAARSRIQIDDAPFLPESRKNFGDRMELIEVVNRVLLTPRILGTKWFHERSLASNSKFNRQTPDQSQPGNRKNLRDADSVRVSLTTYGWMDFEIVHFLVIINDKQGTLTRHIIQTQGLIREKTIWKILEIHSNNNV